MNTCCRRVAVSGGVARDPPSSAVRFSDERNGQRLPEVSVTSSRTRSEVSPLSKCHSVAGEFIEISPFRQMPQKIHPPDRGQTLRACNPLLADVSGVTGGRRAVQIAGRFKERRHLEVYLFCQRHDTGQIKSSFIDTMSRSRPRLPAPSAPHVVRVLSPGGHRRVPAWH